MKQYRYSFAMAAALWAVGLLSQTNEKAQIAKTFAQARHSELADEHDLWLDAEGAISKTIADLSVKMSTEQDSVKRAQMRDKVDKLNNFYQLTVKPKQEALAKEIAKLNVNTGHS